jgi:hypothetical protein
MWASCVVKVEVPADRCPGVADGVIGPKIDLLGPQTRRACAGHFLDAIGGGGWAPIITSVLLGAALPPTPRESGDRAGFQCPSVYGARPQRLGMLH